MRTSSHKQKNEKNRLQKRIQTLQAERDELNTKLLEYESEIAEQVDRFNGAEQEYKNRIHSLERKLQLQCHKEAPVLRSKIANWIFFGVACSILPLVVNILLGLILGYKITLSAIISDFLLVLFAVSINLISILFDSINRSLLSRTIYMALMFFSMISLELSILLSSKPVFVEPSQNSISIIFVFALISFVIVAILGVVTIIWQSKK